MTPEGAVKAAVKRVLQARGIWHFMPVSTPLGAHGIPDFICVVPPHGRFLAIETKAPGKRANTTPNQDRVLAAIAVHGGLQLVVDDAKQLVAYLERETAYG